MLNVATVCCTPPPFSAIWIGCRIDLTPTLSIASRCACRNRIAEVHAVGLSGKRARRKSSADSSTRGRTVGRKAFRNEGSCGAHLRRELREARADRREESVLREPRRREELVLIAVLDELIGKPEVEDRRGDALGREAFRDCAAGAARRDVVLHGDEQGVCPGELRDERVIE